MGIRANVLIKREIEYGDSSYFNNRQLFLKDFIHAIESEINSCVLYCSELNEDGCGDWELDASKIEEVITFIKSKENHEKIISIVDDIKEDSYCSEDSSEELLEELIMFFEDLNDSADKRNGCVYISWF